MVPNDPDSVISKAVIRTLLLDYTRHVPIIIVNLCHSSMNIFHHDAAGVWICSEVTVTVMEHIAPFCMSPTCCCTLLQSRLKEGYRLTYEYSEMNVTNSVLRFSSLRLFGIGLPKRFFQILFYQKFPQIRLAADWLHEQIAWQMNLWILVCQWRTLS